MQWRKTKRGEYQNWKKKIIWNDFNFSNIFKWFPAISISKITFLLDRACGCVCVYVHFIDLPHRCALPSSPALARPFDRSHLANYMKTWKAFQSINFSWLTDNQQIYESKRKTNVTNKFQSKILEFFSSSAFHKYKYAYDVRVEIESVKQSERQHFKWGFISKQIHFFCVCVKFFLLLNLSVIRNQLVFVVNIFFCLFCFKYWNRGYLHHLHRSFLQMKKSDWTQSLNDVDVDSTVLLSVHCVYCLLL